MDKNNLERRAYETFLDLMTQAGADKIVAAVKKELSDQRQYLKMIASENYCSITVQMAMGNLFTDKYAEGSISARYYAGCTNADDVEREARDRCIELFDPEKKYGLHANVQPHSGSDANIMAYMAILSKWEESFLEEKQAKLSSLDRAGFSSLRGHSQRCKMVSMGLSDGGHLTHGYRMNVSARLFDVYSYGVDPSTGFIDYDELESIVEKAKPYILVAGYSAYTRKIDFERMRDIADKYGACLFVDMAHFSGLVAGGVFKGKFNPVSYADIITSTTHKTLRGPRGGIILCKKEWRSHIDKGCPHAIGGPLLNMIVAKAIAFMEAASKEFKDYSAQVVKNADALAQKLIGCGATLLTGGTENHMVIIHVAQSFSLTGMQAEKALFQVGIVVNRNAVPKDSHGMWLTSGIRLGTPALTTRGLKEGEMEKIAEMIVEVLSKTQPHGNDGKEIILDSSYVTKKKEQIRDLLEEFPLYEQLQN